MLLFALFTFKITMALYEKHHFILNTIYIRSIPLITPIHTHITPIHPTHTHTHTILTHPHPYDPSSPPTSLTPHQLHLGDNSISYDKPIHDLPRKLQPFADFASVVGGNHPISPVSVVIR